MFIALRILSLYIGTSDIRLKIGYFQCSVLAWVLSEMLAMPYEILYTLNKGGGLVLACLPVLLSSECS